MYELTKKGRAWAEKAASHPLEPSIMASVALRGTSTGWPTNFVQAAIKTANEEGEKKK